MNYVSQVCPHGLDLSVCALDTALDLFLTQLTVERIFVAVASCTTVSCWGKDTLKKRLGAGYDSDMADVGRSNKVTVPLTFRIPR